VCAVFVSELSGRLPGLFGLQCWPAGDRILAAEAVDGESSADLSVVASSAVFGFLAGMRRADSGAGLGSVVSAVGWSIPASTSRARVCSGIVDGHRAFQVSACGADCAALFCVEALGNAGWIFARGHWS